MNFASKICSKCESCARLPFLERLGLKMDKWDYAVALAGNPNTGKSTVFNQLTGLRQHTGNWPGKTIARAEGGFQFQDKKFKLVDLPGTYSLLSASPDEEIARDFILFGKPDVTVVVADATRLERNLNLVLQILQHTPNVVVCLNLMDEAKAHGLEIDWRGLSRELGVPVVPVSARQGEGVDALIEVIHAVAISNQTSAPYQLKLEIPELAPHLETVARMLEDADIPRARWLALRLLEGDARITSAVKTGELAELAGNSTSLSSDTAGQILETVEQHRWELPENFHDRLAENLYAEAARLAAKTVQKKGRSVRLWWERKVDEILTGKWTGIPVMILLFGIVLWITIAGANVPSAFLSDWLIGNVYPFLKVWTAGWDWPWWLRGVLVDGMYLTSAWVVSVMLPPMAIFFPLFTMLEDLGYLPRVAFNLDRAFQKVGAHGKQALTMSMGLGCNAAGVIAARIIDSPRERLLAIITNNFSLCNGRWPTQILIASVFLGVLIQPPWDSFLAALSVLGVALLGFGMAFGVSWLLTRTALKGEVSAFSLELPPYRPPNVLRTLYTSLIDRTMFVLWRAMVFALPAGVVIWLIANVQVAGLPVAEHLESWLEPLGWFLGLNGIILLAYIVAIPANEIVIPTVLMLTVLSTSIRGVGERGAGVLFETEGEPLRVILEAGGWTTLTAVCLMLFSLAHNPCSTTIYTIWKETRSVKWTAVSTFLPLAIGVVLCALVAGAWRVFL